LVLEVHSLLSSFSPMPLSVPTPPFLLMAMVCISRFFFFSTSLLCRPFHRVHPSCLDPLQGYPDRPFMFSPVGQPSTPDSKWCVEILPFSPHLPLCCSFVSKQSTFPHFRPRVIGLQSFSLPLIAPFSMHLTSITPTHASSVFFLQRFLGDFVVFVSSRLLLEVPLIPPPRPLHPELRIPYSHSGGTTCS